jgi:Rad52/22 family double-strand break repair protein
MGGEAQDCALKAAETDGTNRAVASFGKPFGLALHGKGKTIPYQRLSESRSILVKRTDLPGQPRTLGLKVSDE